MNHEDQRISCNGGGGALGHPVVWYAVSPRRPVQCQYCGTVLSVEPNTESSDDASAELSG